VAEYLELNDNDRLLSVLPLSFDYGMNQLTTMFLVGGCAVLMNHLFPKDIITILDKEKITGLAAVPPLWLQLSQLPWPTSITEHLRFITNSGGHMPKETLGLLRKILPKTKPYLMYGLTEAFRSTYLPPSEIDNRQDSMGKAIPNAEILVVRPDGTPCDANEPGELVHRGVLVSLGYWNDPEKTAERFKPCPGQNKSLPITELAVWSGDIVKKDQDGFLYYVGRNDETIKTSGYRVSPTEVEEMFYNSKLVNEVVAFGVPHQSLGHGIYVIVKLSENNSSLTEANLKLECQKKLPAYMVPHYIEITNESLPRNSNGKIDRKTLSTVRQNQLKMVQAGHSK
jgi:acyl-CoA synthetase (AMP-forming)/AMP-acid ligase II